MRSMRVALAATSTSALPEQRLFPFFPCRHCAPAPVPPSIPVPISFGLPRESVKTAAMNQVILTINGIDFRLGAAAAAFAVVVLALLATIALIAARAVR